MFNGVMYAVDVEGGFEGICDNPDARVRKQPYIRLPNCLPFGGGKLAKDGFKWVIHESLHASKWDLEEKDVERMAEEISGLLWRLGYRRYKGDSK